MAKVERAEPTAEPRVPLSRERVLRAAVALADESGIESLTMRTLGQKLGVEAMSLYNHVANKEDILDGMVDAVMSEVNDVVGEIDVPAGEWKTAMRRRILSAREIFLRHPWAPGVLESRTNTSTALMRYNDSVIGLFLHVGLLARPDASRDARPREPRSGVYTGAVRRLAGRPRADEGLLSTDGRRVSEHRRDAQGSHP